MDTLNPTHIRMLGYFVNPNLPESLRRISDSFYEVAEETATREGADPAETTVALRKLMEAKDCAIRAVIAMEPQSNAPEIRIALRHTGSSETVGGVVGLGGERSKEDVVSSLRSLADGIEKGDFDRFIQGQQL